MSVLLWFERNLSLPDRSKLHRRAIFWFKAHAAKVVRRAWDLALALNEHGPPAEIFKTRRPGYIVYEDDQQIAAIPFRDTFRGASSAVGHQDWGRNLYILRPRPGRSPRDP